MPPLYGGKDTMHVTASTPRRDAGRLTLAMGLLVAMLVASVAPVTLGTAPAYAAEGRLCTDGGVSVVVDHQDLGGGVEQTCVEDGAGKLASEVFADAGHDLTPVGAFPGAACQVDGQPTDAQCEKMPPADAYWGLFIADGGTWGYAPTGVDELRLEDGAFVGFSWQSSSTPAPPGVDPVAATAEPSPTAEAQSDAQSDPQSDAGPPETPNTTTDLSWWVAALVVLLLGAGAALAGRRRRRGDPSR